MKESWKLRTFIKIFLQKIGSVNANSEISLIRRQLTLRDQYQDQKNALHQYVFTEIAKFILKFYNL